MRLNCLSVIRLSVVVSVIRFDLVVHLEVSDLAVHERFWRDVLQLESRGVHQFACGRTLIELTGTERPRRPGSWKARGWSYLTLQVRDCAREHQQAINRGAREAGPPKRMGDSAIISFIRDPDGNFIELSQKASLVGLLEGAASDGAEGPRERITS